MEKVLKLYKYIDGINDAPFPSESEQIVVANFRYDAKRMSSAPTIGFTSMHRTCLDDLWSDNVYARFNGERYFIKQTPTSSYSNADTRYKHEVELVSERIILDNVYFYDVVDSESTTDSPVSNGSKFTFFGTINEFCERLNQSLKYSKVGYSVVVDEGVSSEAKLVSFQDQFFSNVLQEIYNIYEIPYYFEGKVIHIGFTNNAITRTFKYGHDESLLSIQKQNANYKIVNRVTGVGSADNIPYYYPNDDEKGESKPLYNDNEDVAYVSDVNKYKKVKIYDIFKYVNQSSYTTTILDTDDYRMVSIYSSFIGDGLFNHYVRVEYKLEIDEGDNITFFLYNDLSETKSLSYLVWRLGVNESYGTYSDNERVIALTAGEYVITLSWTIENVKEPMAMEKELESLVKNNLNFYATREHGYDVDTWTLEGKNISLSSYGISLNTTPKNGDTISFKRVGYIKPQTNLMPSIYRETFGNERFYNALNGTYVSPQTGEYYHFNNPYIEGKPKEHIVNFEHIKPSIVGMTNSNGLRIDMFTEFAYDDNDNDETDEEGNYLHPYFFGKLRRFDGTYGFNLFDHSIEEEEMVISMTSGSCGGCEFIIGVDDENQKNLVQVDERGNLLRDEQGNVRCGREGTQKEEPQDTQNDTRNNEVWVALKKDINTFGVIIPNATNNYRPSVGDTFVILHIDLPKAYILAAEDKLKEELIKYMSTNNDEKFNFSITFSRIFFAENPQVLAQLNENARIQIEYDNERYELYVSSFSYAMSNDQALPEIRVELSDMLTVSQNALQSAISDVKQDIMNSVGSIDFLTQGLRYFIRKDVDDRSKGKIASDKAIEVGNYVSGASGAIIYKDEENGQTVAEFDKLYVRMKAYFETLEIINVNTIGGKQIISPAGSVKCIGVEETDNAYRCYFLAEQDGEKVQNRWKNGDQAYSQMFNAKVGVSNNISNKYYWRLVASVSSDSVEFEGKQCHYIALSKTDCDAYSDIPSVGDVINQRGNRTDLDRMNFIEMSSVDAFSPNITLFHGVNSYSLDGKAYVSYGVDKSTNKAFMNVYGDMYVGDRKGSSYMRYTQENGLEISGTLSVGTKLGDTPLKDLISASSPEGYQEFVEKVTQDIEGLQAQIDGAIESYFYQYDPALGNYPASEWMTNGTEKVHLNDTFTNLVSGRSWRWSLDGTTYKWVEITDTAAAEALRIAGEAADTADGKRRVFVDTPKPPYDKGDLWSRGSDYPMMICVNPKSATQTYEASDFDYADNNAKLKEEMQEIVNDTKDDLNNAIGQAKNEAVNNANAYTDEGKKALQASINAMEQSKANLDDVYTKSQADGKITESETKAIAAAKAQADAAIALSETIIKSYADGKVTAEEQARIKQAQENLEAAKKYADEAAQAVEDEINSNYGYLSQALNKAPQTEVNQGLVLTSLIQMRNTSSSIMSGLNGLYGTKREKSIATWWGGDMHDLEDYYTWNGTEWLVKSNVTVPTNIPSGLIRFDGTGYLAKGKFWWDESGKIYADPTALFLMFDVEDEAKSLSATILSILDKQKEFEDMWLIKKDANGNEYIYSKYHIATQYGMTMYGDATTLNIPSIYNGLPIDGSTIYWENGILKSKGSSGGGGGLDITALQNYLTQNSYLNVTGGDNRYLKLSGGTITGPLEIKCGADNKIVINNTDGEGYSRIVFQENGSYIGQLLSTKDGNIHWRESKIWHSGNFNPSNYLPLSGGTMTGNILLGGITTNKIGTNIVDTSGGFQEFTHQNSNGYIALGPFNGSVAHIYTDRPSFYFNKDLYVNDAKVWHAGNDGSGSGLDADLLDGRQPSELNVGSADVLAKSFSENINYGIYHSALKLIYNTQNDNYGFPNFYVSGLSVMAGYTGWQLMSYGGDVENPYFRSLQDTGAWKPWRQIAFLTDNVASATKLQTARTIWGQSFDGTGNVSGVISGVDGISFSSSNAINIDYNSNFVFKYTHLQDWSIQKQNTTKIFIVRNDGNVGINTDSPRCKFSITSVGTGSNPSLGALATVNTVGFGDNAYKTYFWTRGTGNGYIQVGREDGNTTAYNLILQALGGNVGIGTENPVSKCDINGLLSIRLESSSAKQSSLNLMNTSSDLWQLSARYGTSDNGNFNIYYYNGSTWANPISINKNGNLLSTGGITMYSDQRKKTILNHVELSLKQIAEAPLIEHYYNSDENKTTHVGSIAQYWASMNDWFCKLDNEGYYTMEIQNAALASAISIARELDRYESKTDKTIKQLKKRICQLEEEVERLRAS